MIIDHSLLNKISSEAKASSRLRMNYNFHEGPDSKAQRLLNVLIPGTVLPIHRHRQTAETYILLRGKMIVIFYDELGNVKEKFLLDPQIGNYGVHIPKDQWHGIEVIEEATIFEVKDGPYTPIEPKDILTL